MLQKIQKFIKKLKDKGQGTVEYALLLGVVAIVLFYLTQSNGLISSVETTTSNASTQAKAVADAYGTGS